jgi:quercetin dioxygenase-like cupin family protein
MTRTATIPAIFFPAVHELAVFDGDGPRPQFLLDTATLKVIVAGLEPGQQIPAHPESLAVYHFLAGEGVMTVDDEALAVAAGATVIAPAGAARGMRATSRLTFLAVKADAS